MRGLTTLAAIIIIMAGDVFAQRAHQFELSAFGSYTRYDRAFLLDNHFGLGGRLGYFFGERVAMEGDVGYQSGAGGRSDEARVLHGSASLVLNFRAGDQHLLYLLGGYSRMAFGPVGTPYRFTDNGMHGAIGDRVFLSPRAALRVELRAIYMPNTNAGFIGPWAGHIIGSVGLSFFAGGGQPRDTDRDGIVDRQDACPATPTGAVVDPRGCPADSDGDQVFDGLDACPNTAAKAPVDRTGCPLDGDRDGVQDSNDQCPATPNGARVDARGCPLDTDGDLVIDGVDECPATPGGASVDARGCPRDADADNVFDGIDRCPNTQSGVQVDAVGCPISRDSDSDGIDDPRDRCPDTVSGTRVDAAGCPILFTEERTPVVLRDVTFETGRATLKSESFAVLDQVAVSLVANPEIRIEIAGHTDNVGLEVSNLELSQARADAVLRYLATKGVEPTRMVAKGYGEWLPVAPNTTAQGRAQNRRVELRQLP